MTQELTKPPLADDMVTEHRGRDLLGNLAIISAVWLGYSLVRTITADQFGAAMENAANVLNFQRAIGLPSELNFQRGLLERTGIIKAANIYYISVHFPVTVAFLAWVWLRHRSRFARIRNSLIAVTLIGMVLHAVYPLAPPRMIRGFVDTGIVFGPNPYDLGVASTANQLAAMPSLHVGWALVVALGIVWIAKSPLRWLALAHPIITSLVVIATANHYWTDAIVALLLVGVIWLMAAKRVTSTMIRAVLNRPRETTNAVSPDTESSPGTESSGVRTSSLESRSAETETVDREITSWKSAS